MQGNDLDKLEHRSGVTSAHSSLDITKKNVAAMLDAEDGMP
jgi:hypothetical protein